uniref:Uncharacterized protein n=1 Tax=Triticum urartu TaxID=4572 RepID=A0A8R7U6C0_TRIUA
MIIGVHVKTVGSLFPSYHETSPNYILLCLSYCKNIQCGWPVELLFMCYHVFTSDPYSVLRRFLSSPILYCLVSHLPIWYVRVYHFCEHTLF